MNPAEALAAAQDILTTADATTPSSSPHGTALRILFDTYARNGTLDDLGDDLSQRFTTAIALLDKFEGDRATAKSSQKYTALGLVERVATLAAPLFAEAEALDREATALRARTTADAEAVMATFTRAATTDADRRAVESAATRLEQETDPVIREAFILEAARRGGAYDAILRAVFTEIPPPLAFNEAHWRPLASAAVMTEARRLLLERVSPIGPIAWRATILGDLAGALRAAV